MKKLLAILAIVIASLSQPVFAGQQQVNDAYRRWLIVYNQFPHGKQPIEQLASDMEKLNCQDLVAYRTKVIRDMSHAATKDEILDVVNMGKYFYHGVKKCDAE